ncbi:hypothetical protein JOB18_004799 [Solea senegalensis]|uniref:Uncharacterized protein n=1 Tax=Solea senegalensis TaxID=28829 RepID=A0AAV6RYE5_SOLSE|nr:hypothetical protein JOB18_004799 [Solea senegalensis]
MRGDAEPPPSPHTDLIIAGDRSRAIYRTPESRGAALPEGQWLKRFSESLVCVDGTVSLHLDE